ncbi:50S ribosomal protein L36 [Striga asiatica]|uniref:50S ribosomal protein L36 n=1 Tax=Striga asiatica TaxID=4170 RepID=A0A5A7P0V2_STRAF|nr:50S ribosomal protein L36 [Striga asiatica]
MFTFDGDIGTKKVLLVMRSVRRKLHVDGVEIETLAMNSMCRCGFEECEVPIRPLEIAHVQEGTRMAARAYAQDGREAQVRARARQRTPDNDGTRRNAGMGSANKMDDGAGERQGDSPDAGKQHASEKYSARHGSVVRKPKGWRTHGRRTARGVLVLVLVLGIFDEEPTFPFKFLGFFDEEPTFSFEFPDTLTTWRPPSWWTSKPQPITMAYPSSIFISKMPKNWYKDCKDVFHIRQANDIDLGDGPAGSSIHQSIILDEPEPEQPEEMEMNTVELDLVAVEGAETGDEEVIVVVEGANFGLKQNEMK